MSQPTRVRGLRRRMTATITRETEDVTITVSVSGRPRPGRTHQEAVNGLRAVAHKAADYFDDTYHGKTGEN